MQCPIWFAEPNNTQVSTANVRKLRSEGQTLPEAFATLVQTASRTERSDRKMRRKTPVITPAAFAAIIRDGNYVVTRRAYIEKLVAHFLQYAIAHADDQLESFDYYSVVGEVANTLLKSLKHNPKTADLHDKYEFRVPDEISRREGHRAIKQILDDVDKRLLKPRNSSSKTEFNSISWEEGKSPLQLLRQIRLLGEEAQISQGDQLQRWRECCEFRLERKNPQDSMYDQDVPRKVHDQFLTQEFDDIDALEDELDKSMVIGGVPLQLNKTHRKRALGAYAAHSEPDPSCPASTETASALAEATAAAARVTLNEVAAAAARADAAAAAAHKAAADAAVADIRDSRDKKRTEGNGISEAGAPPFDSPIDVLRLIEEGNIPKLRGLEYTVKDVYGEGPEGRHGCNSKLYKHLAPNKPLETSMTFEEFKTKHGRNQKPRDKKVAIWSHDACLRDLYWMLVNWVNQADAGTAREQRKAQAWPLLSREEHQALLARSLAAQSS